MIVVLFAACSGPDPSKVSEPLDPTDTDLPETETTDMDGHTPTDTSGALSGCGYRRAARCTPPGRRRRRG